MIFLRTNFYSLPPDYENTHQCHILALSPSSLLTDFANEVIHFVPSIQILYSKKNTDFENI